MSGVDGFEDLGGGGCCLKRSLLGATEGGPMIFLLRELAVIFPLGFCFTSAAWEAWEGKVSVGQYDEQCWKQCCREM